MKTWYACKRDRDRLGVHTLYTGTSLVLFEEEKGPGTHCLRMLRYPKNFRGLDTGHLIFVPRAFARRDLEA